MDQHDAFQLWLPQLPQQAMLPPAPAAPSSSQGPGRSSLKRPRSPLHPQGHAGDDGELDAEGEPDIQLPQPPPELFFHPQPQHPHHLPLPAPPSQPHAQPHLHLHLDHQALHHQHELLHVDSDKPIATNSRVQAAAPPHAHDANAVAGPSSGAGVGVAGGQTQQQQQQQDDDSVAEAEPGAMPDKGEFDTAVEGYIQALHPIKRNKALMSPSLHELVLAILLDPQNTKQGDPQLRFWVRQRFNLQSGTDGNFVMHEEKKVVLRTALFDVISAAHALSQHGGRDKTYAEVKKLWSYVPKEVVTVFVKMCPTCNGKRVTVKGKRPKIEKRAPLPKDILNGPADDGVPDTNGSVPASRSAAPPAAGPALAPAPAPIHIEAALARAMPVAGPSSSTAVVTGPPGAPLLLPIAPFQLQQPPLPFQQQQQHPPAQAQAQQLKPKPTPRPRQIKPKPPAPPAAASSSSSSSSSFAPVVAPVPAPAPTPAPPKRSGRKSAQAAAAGISALAAFEQEDDEDREYRVRKEEHGGAADLNREAELGAEKGEKGAGEASDEDAPGELDAAAATSDAVIDPSLQFGGGLLEGYSVGMGGTEAAGGSAEALHALYRPGA